MIVHGDAALIFEAFTKAQAEFEPPKKTKKAAAFKGGGYTYADMAEVLDATRPALAKHGLAVLQPPSMDGSTVTVETFLIHVSGAYIQFAPFTMPVGKIDPQGIGTAVTYCRRYAYAAALGVAAEDDDASETTAAMRQPERRRQNAKQVGGNVPASLDDVEPDAGDIDAVDGTPTEVLRHEFHTLGRAVYGEGWDEKQQLFAEAMKVPSSNELSAQQLSKLIQGMRMRSKV